jgi:serine/threonine protein kinase
MPLSPEELKKYEHRINPRDAFRLKGLTLNKKYYLDAYIGSGGMGIIYLASDIETKEVYAIKILKPEIVARNAINLTLFENEEKAVRKLVHPHIVKAYDSNTDSEHDLTYIIMEWLEAETLEERILKQKLSLEETTIIFKQICKAIQFAHSQKVLHLDLKPGNVMLLKDVRGEYTVKIIDFGLSKLISSESGTTVTKFGGTFQYCSPEHFGGKHNYQSDIYSLGRMLYEMLTGVIPAGGSYVHALQFPNLDIPPLPPIKNQDANLPEKLDNVIRKAVSRDPRERQQSVKELFQEYEKALITTVSALIVVEGVLDQSFVTPHNLGCSINEGYAFVAQTYTAKLTGKLVGVNINIQSESKFPFHVAIRKVKNGAPTSTILGEITLPGGKTPLSQLITFPQVIYQIKGTQYAIVVNYEGAPPAGAGKGQGIWSGAIGDKYPYGDMFLSSDNGLSWVAYETNNHDVHFRTYVEVRISIDESDDEE